LEKNVPPPGWYKPKLESIKPHTQTVTFSKKDRFKDGEIFGRRTTEQFGEDSPFYLEKLSMMRSRLQY
jgi:hypothetical protein